MQAGVELTGRHLRRRACAHTLPGMLTMTACCSEDHVGSLCVQVETEDGTKTGGDQSMTWDSLGVTMWSGMPGLNYSVVESRSPITATT